MTKAYQKFQDLMFKPVDPGTLALFRIAFGGLLAYLAYKEAVPWLIHYRFVQPKCHFTFALFDLLGFQVLSEELLLIVTKLVGISAILIALGLYFRLALMTFFVSFGYLFLLEKSLYNNHHYLILLLSFLFLFTGANRSISLDAMRHAAAPAKIPFWNIFLLRAQICIVYFFAAVPKLYPDFLAGRHMSIWLITQDKLPFLMKHVPHDVAVIVLTYAAVAFDLFIAFLLCYRRTRLFAVAVAIAFHLLNSYMFPIGIFPYLMISSLILFIDPDKFPFYWQRLLSWLTKINLRLPLQELHPFQSPTKRKMQITMTLMALYLLVQILLPLRHFAIPGNVNWTKEGNYFSWMLMSNVVHGTLNVVAIDPSTNENIPVNEDLNVDQYVDLVVMPDMIYQYVQCLKKDLEARGIEEPAIYVDAKVSVNGRRHHQLIDPNVNLAAQERRFMTAADWILPPPPTLE